MSSPQGRFSDGARLLDGRTLREVYPYGKHLWYSFGDGLYLHVHLGLYGKFAAGEGPPPEPRGALRLRMVGEGIWLDLRGPTACEVHTPPEREALLARLGPDPLLPNSDDRLAYGRITRSRAAVGKLLMDQSVVAGIGNIYRAELLFRAGISPERPGNAVTEDEWNPLWADTKRLMLAGVRAGRIVTTRPEHRERKTGRASRHDAFYVYGREGLPCRLCGTAILKAEMAARKVFWCPTCQPG